MKCRQWIQPGALIRDNALVLSRNDVADSAEEVTEWAKGLGLNAASEVQIEGEANTVLNAVPTPGVQQSLYLWEEDNVPAVTEYTINNGSYSDDPDFRPYLTYFPVPDELDSVSANAAADGMIYSFYCYGPIDPFYEQFLANAKAAEQAGVSVERLELEGMPHGFGAEGGWLEPYGQWLSSIFENN